MAYEKKSKQINKFAIFIHQLLPEDKDVALSYFSKHSIEKLKHQSDGLRIFFKEYDTVRKSILRRNIEVNGLFYKIYPLVTNLTILGIGPHATNSVIEDIMQSYGFIIDSYRIEETVVHDGEQTVSLTNDYRIILDVPEVHAPKLKPVILPNMADKTFDVLFFCRLCRRNGHMQFQCPKIVRGAYSSSKYHQNRKSYRKSSHASDSEDSSNRNCIDHHQFPSYSNQRNYTIRPNSQEKRKEERSYFSDQICSPKHKYDKTDIPKDHRLKSINSKSNFYSVHNTDRQDNFSSAVPEIPDVDPRNVKNINSSHRIKYSDSRSKYCIIQETAEKINRHKKHREDDFSSSRNYGNENSRDHSSDHRRSSHSKSKNYSSQETIDELHIHKNHREDDFSLRRNYDNKNSRDNSLYSRRSSHSKPKNYSSCETTDEIKIHKNHREDNFSSTRNYGNENCRDNSSNHRSSSYSKPMNYSSHETVDDVSSVSDGGDRGVRNSSKRKRSPSSKEKESKRKRNCEKRNFLQQCDNEIACERIQDSTPSQCCDKTAPVSSIQKKKKSFADVLSSLLPPNTNLMKAFKLIKTAFKCAPKDVPKNVITALAFISEYNRELKVRDKDARCVLKKINTRLHEIGNERKRESEKSPTDASTHSIKKEEGICIENERSTAEIPKQPSSRKRITLSLGIKEAISKTVGVLPPDILCNFLNHVRGRKKWFEVASVFTENMQGLASQLLEVEKTYYKCIQRRGKEEDRDIRYIKTLRLKLEKHNSSATQKSFESEEHVPELERGPEMERVPLKTEMSKESDMTDVHIKTESDVTEMSMEMESDAAEIFVRSESDMEEINMISGSDMEEIFVKAESDAERMPVKAQSDAVEILVKEELNMTDVSIENEVNMTETIKNETDVFMKQSVSEEHAFKRNSSSNNLYGASYYTNITQMPFNF